MTEVLEGLIKKGRNGGCCISSIDYLIVINIEIVGNHHYFT